LLWSGEVKNECVVLRVIKAWAPRFLHWCLIDNCVFLPILLANKNAKYACVVKTVDWVKNKISLVSPTSNYWASSRCESQ
jgi:hypothetical protein